MDDPFVVRNLVYGVEDSLLSTTGVVVGVSFAGLSRREIIVTGLVLVLVEALSMSFGSFVSEDSFMEASDIQHTPGKVFQYALIMFFSYVLAGLVPLIPFILDVHGAWKYSVGLAIGALFCLILAVQKKPRKAAAVAGVGAVILGASISAGRVLK